METITGNTLINLGYKPSHWFKDALLHLNEVGADVDYIQNYCNQKVSENATLSVLDKPVPYGIFVISEGRDEIENFEKSIEAMNRIMVTPTVVAGAIMPDVCPVGGNNVPVGGVVVTEGTIHPLMHSSDVCCSVATSELNPDIDVSELLDIAMQVTHFGAGGRKRWQYGLEDDPLYPRIMDNYFTRDYIEKAISHMATQGDGNHFLFVGRSEATGNIHIVTHHGSRGFGASVYKKGLHEAERFCRRVCPNTKNPWLNFSDDLGKEYWEALQIIKNWTHLNHRVIHNRIINKLRTSVKDAYWNEHNFVFKDEDMFYHAKGSTPMKSKFNVGDGWSSKRLIPLNMAQPVLVVEESETNIFGFAPHGAGRNLSRAEFNRRYKDIDLYKSIQGLDVRFYSGEADLSEFPAAYKNADEVVRQIEYFGLAKVVDKIQPLGCIMAGEQKISWKK